MAKGSFPCMPIEDICKLSVKDISDDNSMLFLWATMPKLREALHVIEAWGFKYITCAFTWVKENPKNGGIYSGLGHWTNGNAELCLFAKRGHPKRLCKSVKQIQMWPRGRHSVKPPQIRNEIIRLVGDLPRIELFARQKTEGWDVWGNEIESDIVFGERNDSMP